MTSMAVGVRYVRRTKSRTDGLAAAAEEELGYPPGRRDRFGVVAPSLDIDDYTPGIQENLKLLNVESAENYAIDGLRKMMDAVRKYINKLDKIVKNGNAEKVDVQRFLENFLKDDVTRVRDKVWREAGFDPETNDPKKQRPSAANTKPGSKAGSKRRVRFNNGKNNANKGGGRRRTRRGRGHARRRSSTRKN